MIVERRIYISFSLGDKRAGHWWQNKTKPNPKKTSYKSSLHLVKRLKIRFFFSEILFIYLIERVRERETERDHK